VLGKGNKERVVFIGNGAALALQDWITIRGAEPGPLFLPVTKHGKIVPTRMSTQAVFAICRRRAEESRVPAFSPHDLRRSCASDLLDAGEDLATVQRHLGHSSPVVTARYDRRGDAVLKRAAGKLHFPYARVTAQSHARTPG
jgi:integrase